MSINLPRILLIPKDEVLAEIVKLSLSVTFEVETIVIKNREIDKITNYFKPDEVPSCIIIDENIPYSSLVKVSKVCQEATKIVPIIGLFSPSNIDDEKLKVINFYAKIYKTNVTNSLYKILSNFLTPGTVEKNYYEVSISAFLHFNQIEADLYLKLSDEKHVKVFKSGDYFSEGDFEKYKEKKIENLYVNIDDVNSLIQKLEAILVSLKNLSLQTTVKEVDGLVKSMATKETQGAMLDLSKSLKNISDKNLSFRNAIQVCESTLDTVHKTASRFGINHDVEKLIKVVTILALHTIKISPKLEDLLKSRVKEENGYTHNHSVMTANISCLIAELLGWKSSLTFFKLILAAYLHDLSITNSKIASIQSLQELNRLREELTQEEIDLYLNHPENSAKMAREFHLIPANVDLVIYEHHERPDGSGFPRKINFTQISPLSALFIVAHDLVNYIVSPPSGGGDWNIADFLNRHQSIYKEGLFAHIYNAMWKAYKAK